MILNDIRWDIMYKEYDDEFDRFEEELEDNMDEFVCPLMRQGPLTSLYLLLDQDFKGLQQEHHSRDQLQGRLQGHHRVLFPSRQNLVAWECLL